MFQRLQTKLTVLYAGLFALALSLVAVTVYVAIASNAQRTVRQELAASGTVFDRVWALRTEQRPTDARAEREAARLACRAALAALLAAELGWAARPAPFRSPTSAGKRRA